MEIVKLAGAAVLGVVLGVLLLVWATAAMLVLLPAGAGLGRLAAAVLRR